MLRSSILTIGTEITDGDILNSNAQWLSQRLFALNWRVLHQLTVPDEKGLMLSALDFLSKQSELIVITGGLGPTSDDFTRNVVAEFVGQPLEFDEEKWQKLVAIYAQLQMSQHAGHRNQALFPKGSQRLENTSGTADGFWCSHKQTDFVVLPGPPRELMPIWSGDVEPALLARSGPMDKPVLFYFKVFGLPESEVAAPTEELFANENAVRLSFRAQVPFVHVKLLMPQGRAIGLSPKIEKLRKILRPHQVTESDLALLFAQYLLREPARIVDEVTGGQLQKRLYESAVKAKIAIPIINQASDTQNEFRILRAEASSILLRSRIGKNSRDLEVELPHRIATRETLLPLFVTELALIKWAFLLGFPEVADFADWN